MTYRTQYALIFTYGSFQMRTIVCVSHPTKIALLFIHSGASLTQSTWLVTIGVYIFGL